MTYDPEYHAKYYAEHAEEKRQKARAYYQKRKNDPEFKEKARKRATAWYEAHKDDPEFKKLHAERGEQWKEDHHEAWLAWRRKRWAERRGDPAFVAQRKEQGAKYRAKKFGPYEEAILAAKKSGCCICSEMEPVCLDFHHIDPATKKFRIAAKASIPSLEALLEEIAKCVVICANCHRRFHAGELKLPTHITDYTPSKQKNGMLA